MIEKNTFVADNKLNKDIIKFKKVKNSIIAKEPTKLENRNLKFINSAFKGFFVSYKRTGP